MNKKIIWPILIFLIIAGGWFLAKKQKSAPAEKPVEELLSTSTGEKFVEILINSSEEQMANLTPPGHKEGQASDSAGTAYRLAKNGRLYHAVLAIMPDPKEGHQYEGWLVQEEPLQFFSTGVMKKNETGQWYLDYKADQEYPAYLKVVITEEETIDEKPERHVLEGSF